MYVSVVKCPVSMRERVYNYLDSIKYLIMRNLFFSYFLFDTIILSNVDIRYPP